ncbi:MAG: oxygenase MpaB family protein [Tistlia sp.]|uniref:oxygenase MpaB family protein n=1 Tax=Tistlia sp. TaxID=3057121 RepID=UPI0034A3A816
MVIGEQAEAGGSRAVARRGATPLPLPAGLHERVERVAADLLRPDGEPPVDFTEPYGEPALTRPDSVSWQIFRNPVSLMIGGVAAVILELAEPRVRTAIWDQSSFRSDPLGRLKRTGLAAMITVYGPHSNAETMIAGIRRIHERVRGKAPDGRVYRASEPELLGWVQATASYGFLQAYHRYVRHLEPAQRDRAYAEAAVAARLYGATEAPRSEAESEALFARTASTLSASPIVFEFLDTVARTPVLPRGLRAFQPLLIRAAVDLVPAPIRQTLELGPQHGLAAWQRLTVRVAARTADRLLLRSHPAVQACRRLGLPDDYLLGR